MNKSDCKNAYIKMYTCTTENIRDRKACDHDILKQR